MPSGEMLERPGLRAYLGRMPNVNLWTGLPGSGRENAAGEYVLDATRSGKTAWWLVDSQRRAEAVETRLLAQSDGAYAGVEVVVAGRLPMTLLQVAGQDPQPISTEVRELILRELLEGEAERANSPSAATEGWARKLVDIYLRLQVGEEHLEGKLAKRYPWILGLLRQYRDLLAARSRVDESDLPRIASDLLAEGGITPPDLFVVDRLGPVPPDVLVLIHDLGLAAAECIAIVDWVSVGGPALDLSRQHLEGWQGLLQCTEKSFPVDEHHASLFRRLFTAAGDGDTAHSSTLNVASSHHPDRSAEVRSVARELARLIYEESLPPEEAAVICTRLEDYEALIGELFPLYGLLPDVRIGPRLDRNPVAKAVLGLFELRAKGFTRERVTELLLNPYVRWGRTLATSEGVLAFDTVARGARIRDEKGSFERVWRKPIEKNVERLKRQLERLDPQEEEIDVEEGDGGSSRGKRRRLEIEIRQAERALGELQELVRQIEQLPDTCSSEEASEWLDGILTELGVVDAASRAARVNPGEGGEDMRALGQIKLAMEQAATALQMHGRKRWPVARMSEVLHYAISGVRLRPSSRLCGGVQVGGPLELRGLRVKSLFLLGMTASRWPRSPELDLADPLTGRWSTIDRLAESRAMTAEALVGNDHVRFSMPAPRDGEGSEAPSPLLAELEAAGVEIAEAEEESTLRSPLELLSMAGALAGERSAVPERLLAELGEVPNADPEASKSAIEIELTRQNPSTLTRYEGQLTDDPVASLVAEQLLFRPLSATRLDSYARCPMQFFLGHVLGASELEEVEEGIDPLERGNLLHRILARTVRELERLRGEPPDLSEDPEEVARVMDTIAREELQQVEQDNLFGDLLRASVLSGLLDESEPPGYLRNLLIQQTESRNAKQLSGGRARFVEASFGLPEEEDATTLLEEPIVIEHDGVRVPLAGRIDRADHHPEKGWRVYDYKVSASQQPTAAKTLDGLSFQLPVYTWALKEWLAQGHGDPDDFEIARFIQFKPDTVSLSTGWKGKVHDEHSLEVAERVARIHEAMRRGRFHHPLSLDSKLCPEDVSHFYCPYKTICRRDPSLFRERPSALTRELLEGAYRLAFQEFAALDTPEGGRDG